MVALNTDELTKTNGTVNNNLKNFIANSLRK